MITTLIASIKVFDPGEKRIYTILCERRRWWSMQKKILMWISAIFFFSFTLFEMDQNRRAYPITKCLLVVHIYTRTRCSILLHTENACHDMNISDTEASNKKTKMKTKTLLNEISRHMWVLRVCQFLREAHTHTNRLIEWYCSAAVYGRIQRNANGDASEAYIIYFNTNLVCMSINEVGVGKILFGMEMGWWEWEWGGR